MIFLMEQLPHSKAAQDGNRVVRRPEVPDYRHAYKRDVDRILHSKGYARYIDKTQVVYLLEHDHISHRGLHVQLVSAFSRGIAMSLGLNVDLVEAIALGHDVGHPPFGHEGEAYLSALSQEYGAGAFSHPWQSCRLYMTIEPLNLGLAVFDGILCHDGGMRTPTLEPRYGKTWEEHEEDLSLKRADPEADLIPGTLEGCLVKLCDTVTYVARDIEDAISLELIRREELPDTILGKRNNDILANFAKGLIISSQGKEQLHIPEELFTAVHTLRRYNFEHIYLNPHLKIESTRIERAYRYLFEFLLKDGEHQGDLSYIWKNFLYNKNEEYLVSSDPVRRVVDFLAGMTDRYFLKTLRQIVVPQQIEWPW